jgi:aspartate 1-decarboxylase
MAAGVAPGGRDNGPVWPHKCHMRLTMLKSKIHRCTVTASELQYDGSVTVDKLLLESARIVPFEQVHVWNVTRGTRFTTYAIEGEAGSGVVCINGAAAHLAGRGDVVIIAAFCELDPDQARGHRPTVVLVDGDNHPRA